MVFALCCIFCIAKVATGIGSNIADNSNVIDYDSALVANVIDDVMVQGPEDLSWDDKEHLEQYYLLYSSSPQCKGMYSICIYLHHHICIVLYLVVRASQATLCHPLVFTFQLTYHITNLITYPYILISPIYSLFIHTHITNLFTYPYTLYIHTYNRARRGFLAGKDV